MHGLVCWVYSAARVDPEVSSAHGDIHCFVKIQLGPDQAEFHHRVRVMISDQHVGHSGRDSVHKAAGRKSAVLVAQPSLVLNSRAGAGIDHMHCHTGHPSLIH